MARINSWKNWLIQQVTSTTPCNLPIERILAISTTGLGDTLFLIPALDLLRASFPNAYLAVLTSATGEQIVRHHPGIDKIYWFEDPLFFKAFRLRHALKKDCFDTALLFHTSQRLVLPLSAWAGIPRRIGTFGRQKGLDALLTEGLTYEGEHEVERRVRLLKFLGIKEKPKAPRYFMLGTERAEAKQKFNDYVGKKKILFHPGSKEACRRWPLSCFAKLGTLLEKEGAQIFITVSKEEASIGVQLKSYLPNAHILTPHSIRQLASWIHPMDLMVSNDTGPLHLAAALDVPCIGLYVVTHPQQCAPLASPHFESIQRNPTCFPCMKRKCQDPFCFLQISPEEVFEVCKRKIFTEML